MKKILLTTTALTLLAGAASAGLSVGGDARLGISSSGGTTTVDRRFRVKFKGSGETDSGVTFGAGAGIRWDDAESTPTTAPNIWGSNVWVSNGTATLTVGNTNGAIANASGIWGGATIGYTGMSFSAIPFVGHSSSSSAGGGSNLASLTMSLGSANIGVSTGIAGAGDTEVAGNFATGALTIGVGYDTGSSSGTSATYFSVGSSLGSADVHLNYASNSTGSTAYSLSATMGVGAGSIAMYLGSVGGGSVTGIGYSQSLGGGAKAAIGIQNIASAATPLTIEAGLAFGF